MNERTTPGSAVDVTVNADVVAVERGEHGGAGGADRAVRARVGGVGRGVARAASSRIGDRGGVAVACRPARIAVTGRQRR